MFLLPWSGLIWMIFVSTNGAATTVYSDIYSLFGTCCYIFVNNTYENIAPPIPRIIGPNHNPRICIGCVIGFSQFHQSLQSLFGYSILWFLAYPLHCIQHSFPQINTCNILSSNVTSTYKGTYIYIYPIQWYWSALSYWFELQLGSWLLACSHTLIVNLVFDRKIFSVLEFALTFKLLQWIF